RFLQGAARYQARQRRDVPERGQTVRREGRRRSGGRDRLLPARLGAAERRSVSVARGRETRTDGAALTRMHVLRTAEDAEDAEEQVDKLSASFASSAVDGA